MNYSLLVDELSNDPRSVGYSSLTNAQKIAALNNPNITTTQPITISGVLEWASVNNRRVNISDAAGNTSNPTATRNAALVALDMLASKEPLDITNASVQSVMTTLVSNSVLAQSDIDALHTLSQVQQSWAQINWGRDVTLTDLTIAGY